MTRNSTQLVILGAGPAGYMAAFLAADQGFKVTLVDKRGSLGGTCLHEGCIPSKTFLHIAEVITNAEEASKFGVVFNPPHLEVEKIQTFKKNVVQKLSAGLTQLCRMRKITFIQGDASFVDENTLAIIKKDDTKEYLSFEKCIIATGGKPQELPGLSFAHSQIMNSEQALDLESIPSRLLVVGGGTIGLEMATIYAALGSKVTLCEMTAGLLPGLDRDLVSVVEKALKKKINILCATTIDSVRKTNEGLKVILKDSMGETLTEVFDKALVAAGRVPTAKDLYLVNTKVAIDDNGFIQTNEFGQTGEKNIYAIGDVRGGLQLAHKASAEAHALVQTLCGKKTPLPTNAVPYVVYTNPEIACCGLSEADARNQNKDIKVVKIPWIASGRALSLNRDDGLTKLIFDMKTQKLLGASIVGPQAGELIGEISLGLHAEIDAEEIAQSIFPHPTLSETIRECAESFLGRNPHAVNRVKRES